MSLHTTEKGRSKKTAQDVHLDALFGSFSVAIFGLCILWFILCCHLLSLYYVVHSIYAAIFGLCIVWFILCCRFFISLLCCSFSVVIFGLCILWFILCCHLLSLYYVVHSMLLSLVSVFGSFCHLCCHLLSVYYVIHSVLSSLVSISCSFCVAIFYVCITLFIQCCHLWSLYSVIHSV